MKITRIVVLLGFFAIPVFAQDPSASVPSRGGCGANQSQFSVATNKKEHPVAQPQAGKAMVYVIEDIFNGPTMRVGLDGAWVGANKGRSYFFFSVDPGEHQLCTKWQSGVFKKTAERVGSAASFTAEAGKAYYFRVLVYERTGVRLEQVEPAEGQFLVSSSWFSTSRPKK